MEILRKGESGAIPFRTGRFFTVDSKWFFTTREGNNHGPYNSKDDAEVNLEFFIGNIFHAEQQLRS